MFVSLSAALVRACGCGEEKGEEDSIVEAHGDGDGCRGGDSTKKRRRRG